MSTCSPEDDALWGAIPEDRRVEWCRAWVDFIPAWLGTIPMMMVCRAVQRGSYTTYQSWVPVAHAFEAAGFTPEAYYLLRLTLRARHATAGASPKVVTYGGETHPKITTLQASDWVLWPELAKTMTPIRATELILADGKQQFPQGALINRSGEILLSTDD